MSQSHRLDYEGTSLIRKAPPPRTIGMGLPKGPRGMHFLVSEVPLYTMHRETKSTSCDTPQVGPRIQGYLAHEETPPRPRTIGIGLPKGPGGRRLLISEGPRYTMHIDNVNIV